MGKKAWEIERPAPGGDREPHAQASFLVPRAPRTMGAEDRGRPDPRTSTRDFLVAAAYLSKEDSPHSQPHRGHGGSRSHTLTQPLPRRQPISSPRVNEQIRISPVRLIDADGEQVGIVSLDAARQKAAEAELDLVEVAEDARPPVVKIMDWGRHQYEQQKKAREARKNQKTQEIKEVQLRPRTDDHDFETKLKRARRFLEDGNIVRIVLRFRGRELRRPEVGVETLERMLESTRDLAKVENFSKRIEGRRLVAVLEPRSD